jgi:hypothetical protein
MASLIDYQDPYSALSQGFSQGLGNIAQILQMRYARRQEQAQYRREQRQLQQQKYANRLDQLSTIISFGKTIDDDAKRIQYYKKTLTPDLYRDLPDLKPLVEGFKNLSFEEQKAATPAIKILAKAIAENDTKTVKMILPQIEASGIRDKYQELVKEGYGILQEERKGLMDLLKKEIDIETQGWKPQTKEDALELKRAGATSVTQIVGGERWEAQQRMKASELKEELKTNAKDRDFYESQADDFNFFNKRNEVAYWDETKEALAFGKFKRAKGITIIKLSEENIKAGITPRKVQAYADAHPPMTVKDVLIKIGAIKQ